MDMVCSIIGEQAETALLVAASTARVVIVVLDEHYLGKLWPMKELRLGMQQETCLPVLFGLTYEAFEAKLLRLPDTTAEDKAMLEQLRKISMVIAKEAQHRRFVDDVGNVGFAAVQKLVRCELPKLRGAYSAAELAFVLRVRKAVDWMSNPHHMQQLTKVGSADLRDWRVALEISEKELESCAERVNAEQRLVDTKVREWSGRMDLKSCRCMYNDFFRKCGS